MSEIEVTEAPTGGKVDWSNETTQSEDFQPLEIEEEIIPSPYCCKHKVAVSIGYFLAFFALGCQIAQFGPIMLALEKQTSSKVKQVTMVFTGRALGYLVGTWGGGIL